MFCAIFLPLKKNSYLHYHGIFLLGTIVIFYCISVRIDQDFNNYINQFLLILFQSVMLCYTYIRCGLGLAALAHVRREELLLVLLWDLLTSSRVRPVTLGLIWTQKINWIYLAWMFCLFLLGRSTLKYSTYTFRYKWFLDYLLKNYIWAHFLEAISLANACFL